MILENMHKAEIRETKNFNNVKLLIVNITYKETFCTSTLMYKRKTRTFKKTHGTTWVECVNGEYKKLSSMVSIILDEYCSYKGYCVPTA